tara:strand:- start:4 stop:465 length:462 start_codon:yes stop_codon:yes gene_type:complete
MDINQLLQFYADQGISSRPQPINQGIAAVDYTAPIMPKIIEDQGSSSDDQITIDPTKQGIGAYEGMPIRFRDIAGLFMNPLYGVPNIMARSAGYESPIDFAKQQGQTLIDQRKGRLNITSDAGFENTDSGGNFDGASSMEEYSADPTSFSGSF